MRVREGSERRERESGRDEVQHTGEKRLQGRGEGNSKKGMTEEVGTICT